MTTTSVYVASIHTDSLLRTSVVSSQGLSYSRAFLLLVLFTSVLNLACTGATEASTVDSIRVAPDVVNANSSDTIQLRATAVDAKGREVLADGFSWTTSNQSLGQVTGNGRLFVGRVLSGQPENFRVTATLGVKSGQASIFVAPAPVNSIKVSASSPTLTAGSTRQLSAELKDAYGSVLSGRTVAWGSNSAGIATVSNSGLVTGVTQGTARIVASVGSVSGFLDITVQGSTQSTLQTGDTLKRGIVYQLPPMAWNATSNWYFFSNPTGAAFTVLTSGGSGNVGLYVTPVNPPFSNYPDCVIVPTTPQTTSRSCSIPTYTPVSLWVVTVFEGTTTASGVSLRVL